MVDTRTLALTACAWRLLCGMPSAQGSRDGVGTPPGRGRRENVVLVRGGPPQFSKKRSENAGANENLSGGFAAIPGIAPRVAPRIVGFVLIKS